MIRFCHCEERQRRGNLCLWIASLVLAMTVFVPSFVIADENTPDFNVLCKYLDKEKPQIGIKSVASADYVPGVDVHGRDVTPADVGGASPSFLNDPIIVPIEIDVLQRIGIISESLIGDVKIHSDGRVILGKEDISKPVKSFCDNRVQEHGQKEPDLLPSSDKIEGQYP